MGVGVCECVSQCSLRTTWYCFTVTIIRIQITVLLLWQPPFMGRGSYFTASHVSKRREAEIKSGFCLNCNYSLLHIIHIVGCLNLGWPSYSGKAVWDFNSWAASRSFVSKPVVAQRCSGGGTQWDVCLPAVIGKTSPTNHPSQSGQNLAAHSPLVQGWVTSDLRAGHGLWSQGKEGHNPSWR